MLAFFWAAANDFHVVHRKELFQHHGNMIGKVNATKPNWLRVLSS